MSCYIGIDVGNSRIGIAISDEDKKIAFPLAVVHRENNSFGFKKMKKLLEGREIKAFVVGLPLKSDGKLSKNCKNIFNYVEYLKDFFHIDVITWDERYTTVIAENTLLSANTRRDKRKRVIDKIAAQIILQSYLDHLNK